MPRIAANGIHLNVQFDGADDGMPLLLSNSLASALAMWDRQVPALVDAGYRVIRYDSRGHGESDVTPGPYTVALLAEDAVALMDALEIERAHFCGLSKGGIVGQWLATHHAGRLRSAVLCDTAAYLGGGDVWQQRIDAVAAGGMEAVVDGTLERWFTPAGRERLAADVESVRRMILATPPQGFIACAQAIMAMDQREGIRAVSLPVLVIVGADDPGTPVSAAELIHANIAGSQLVVLENAAHFANVEQAVAFNEALLSFLDVQSAP